MKHEESEESKIDTEEKPYLEDIQHFNFSIITIAQSLTE